MQSKNWGAFLCDCRSTLNVDAQKFGETASLVKVATNPEEDILAFAEDTEQQDTEHVIVGCCADPSIFEKALPGKTLHFLDLKGKCFAPHPDADQSHFKAQKLIQAEIRAAGLRAQKNVPVNPLRVGNRVAIYTEFADGMKLAGKLKDLVAEGSGGLTFCISPETEGLENSPLWDQRAFLVAVEGRLGNLKITLEPDSVTNGGSQRRFDLNVDQLVVLTKTLPEGIKRRTGVHLLTSADDEILEETASQIRDLVGYFHKPEHLIYDQEICAGGDKGIETCGRCITFCPYDAISRQTENPVRIQVDHLTCEGCGACVSACPTSALRFTEPSPQEIYARLSTLLTSTNKEPDTADPPVIMFHCEEMGRKVQEKAGQIPLAALSFGAAGVGLMGCENCPNGERELLYQKIEFSQLILKHFDLGDQRVRILTAEEGQEADAVRALNQFTSELDKTPITSTWATPRQTGNREMLSDVFESFIEQTGKQPGGVKLSSELPYGFAEVKDSGCTLCRSCANVCPTNAFKFSEEDNSLHFKHINCVGCGLCEQVCPERVITLHNELYLEKEALDFTVVAEDEMINCIQCNKPYINRRALEAVESKLFNVESLQHTFSGNRKNILRMCPDCRTVEAMMEVEKGWEP